MSSSIAIDRLGFIVGHLLAYKQPCRAATTAAITLSGHQTIDGVALVDGDRVLVKDQSSARENGIYEVGTSTWELASDFDQRDQVIRGTRVMVTDGTTNALTEWYVTTTGRPRPGYSDIAFAQLSASEISGLTPTDGYAIIGNGTTWTAAGFTQAGTGAVTRTWQNKARDTVSVKDFGAVGDGVTDDKAAFEAAAAASGTVHVPPGSYSIPSALSNSALWHIDDDATIVGLSDLGTGAGVPDTSRLNGRVFHMVNQADGVGIRIGDPDPWLEREVHAHSEDLSEVVILSPYGDIALTVGSRTSDDPTDNFNAIGISAYGVNNNTTNHDTAWGAYFEARRTSNSVTGPTFGCEVNVVNDGGVVDVNPYTDIGAPAPAMTVGAWLASGAEVGLANTSAAVVVLSNGTAFRRGIVFLDGALDSTFGEALAVPAGTYLSWYSSAGDLFGRLTHSLQDWRMQSDTVGHNTDFQRARASAGATQAADIIQRWRFEGWDGSADYQLGVVRCLQRTNFAGGHARGSVDLLARNVAGVTVEVGLNGAADNSFAPTSDNTIALGDASFGWSDLFLGSGAAINFNAGDVTITHAANQITVGGGNLNLASGQVLQVNGTQVVTAQQSSIADLAWTYTANDPGTVPNSAVTFADGTALVAATVYEALDEIEAKMNAVLGALRTHGLIAT